MSRKYGWRPAVPDQRNYVFSLAAPIALPIKVDHRNICPPVYDQGNLGSCTGNAIGAAFHYNHRRLGLGNWVPSRLFIYYNEREREHTIQSDSGATIPNGIKSVVKLGVCPEANWPYDVSRFAERPHPNCYEEALNHRATRYRSVIPGRYLTGIKQAIASGEVVVFGFAVYSSFESQEVARTGVVPVPSQLEEMLGGHAVLAVGYDDEKAVLIVRNSWGESWGDNGYCYMPYRYIMQHASDFWVIDYVS